MTTKTDLVLSIGKREVRRYGRPNKFSSWYASKYHRPPSWLTAPWCAMFASWVGNSAGAGRQFGSFASCPAWVNRFKEEKRWGSAPRVGALVFFDWNHDGVADHVGIVAEVLSKTSIKSLEGNTRKDGHVNSVAIQRRSRGILGYGYWADSPKARTYTVKAGDTLSEIGKRLGLDWRKIADLNKIKDPWTIKPGQHLTLP